MASVGQAYVEIVPTSKGATKQIERQIDGEKAGKTVGSRVMAGVKKAAKIGAVAAAAAVAVIGTASFRAAAGIETAQKTLTGLYGDAGEAKKAMAGLRDVAKDSPIDYQAYLKGGEALAYLGLKSEDATGVLQTMGKAIVGFGGGAEEMNRANDALTRMSSEGKVTRDTLSQLSNTGVPIFDSLAESLGVSNSELGDMITKGQVGLDDVVGALSNPNLDAMQKAIAAGDGAAESFGNVWLKVKDNIITALGSFMVPLMEKLAPVLDTAGAAVSDFISGMQSGEGSGGKFVDVLKTIWDVVSNVFGFIRDNIGVISKLAIAVGIIVGVIKTWAIVQGILNAVMLASPITWIVLAIGVLIAAIVLLIMNWDEVVSFVSDVWGGFIDWITGLLEGFADWWSGIWDGIVEVFANIWNGIGEFFQNFWVGLQVIFQAGVLAFQLIWETVLGVIEAVWNAVWGGIKSFFVGIWNFIVAFVTTYINIVMTIITTVVNVIKNVWSAVWGGIKSFFTTIWSGIVAGVKLYINTVKTIITTVINTVKSIWSSVWGGISSFFSGIWNGIVSTVQKFGGIFKSVFGGIKGFVKSAFSGVVGVVKAPINGIIGLINGAIGALNNLSVTIPDWVPIVGGQTWGLSLPKIPQLASGAIIGASNGGSLVNVGEGRYDEAVVPLGGPQFERLADALVSRGAGSQVTQYITTQQDDPAVQARVWAREASRGLATV
ncbi:tape measure protein [Microbacterium sp. MPKO10]|uniref:phage tail protein n=1 Tax=Microbacterium sp. MPKO10 TaxID=2989818 RepID=UPI0022366D19|nr:tape measure protein [Microbacterium sp. MPKO10]MCW4458189.1 tape measure protein [Microbacterium sp. MPKO10]